MIEVYHANEPTFLPITDGTACNEEYQHVASVQCSSIDDAYRLTNHLQGAWWNNRGVRVHGPRNHRSTSIGDVLVQSDGTAWSVDSFGFTPVSLVTRSMSLPSSE